MKRKRHSAEQIIGKLREAEAAVGNGMALSEVCEKLEISEATLHRWRAQYGGLEGQRDQAAQGAGEAEHPAQEAGIRTGIRREHSQGGAEGKILSPTRKRQAVEQAEKALEVFEPRACDVVGQGRSTQRYVPAPRDQEKALVAGMGALSARHPRHGYWRIGALLRAQRWKLNGKRIYRLWRREGMQVPRRRRKRRALGQAANGVEPRRATRSNEVWSYDFLFDQTMDGRRLKWLPIVDEYSRKDLELAVERRMGRR